MDLMHHEEIDVSFMTETWHDIGSFALYRLRAAFTVIDCPRLTDPNDAPRHCYMSTMVDSTSCLLQVLDFDDM